MEKLKNKNILYFIAGAILVLIIVFLLIQINNKKIDEKWKTDKITISLSDGTVFDVENKETVGRISRLCNDGLFRPVKNSDKIDGNCEIWIDFNNGTIIGMFLNRDYGYLGDSKQYIGDSMYLPSGLNQFIKNVISNNVVYSEIQGEIIESKNLGYLISLDEESKQILDSDEVFVSYENLPFTDIQELDFNIGDIIKVYWNGNVVETFPPQIYCSKLEFIDNSNNEEITPVINQEELNQGYETKSLNDNKEDYLTPSPVENESYFNFKKINLNDSSIIDFNIPSWVLGEVNLNKLYSFNNSDYLIDVLAKEKYMDYYNQNWTEEEKNKIVLGQGIKCFNLDSNDSYVYYPLLINGNIISLLQIVNNSDSPEISLVMDFVNGLNEISSKTSQDSPLILIRKDGVLCGMIEDTIYSESDIDVNDFNLSEISGEVVVNILDELQITEISE